MLFGKQSLERSGWSVDGIMVLMILRRHQGHVIVEGWY